MISVRKYINKNSLSNCKSTLLCIGHLFAYLVQILTPFALITLTTKAIINEVDLDATALILDTINNALKLYVTNGKSTYIMFNF